VYVIPLEAEQRELNFEEGSIPPFYEKINVNFGLHFNFGGHYNPTTPDI